VWACDSKFGNCTDFHSLFISLARTRKLPAKFEMGFPIPEKRGQGDVGGYHCWAWFSPDGTRWVPVDISEANRARESNPKMVDYYFGNLTPDRVTFTTGRDLTLQPPQKGPPVNYLIYPYVEVNGQPYAQSNVQGKFSYEDVR
jgi:transglutaminase-like putative cysteine protease